MSDLTDVRKTMANEVREQEKRAARQSKAFVRKNKIFKSLRTPQSHGYIQF